MIDLENYNAMKKNHDKLFKENTLLHARLKNAEESLTTIVSSSEKSLRDMASMYDVANENVISHLIKNKLVEENSELHYNLLSMMPIKLGK